MLLYLVIILASIATIACFSSMYESTFIEELPSDVVKQNEGLSEIECVLICQRNELAAIRHRNQCYCINESDVTYLNEILEETQTVLFKPHAKEKHLNICTKHESSYVGCTKQYPAKSCKEIKERIPKLTVSGFYWIQLDKPTRVYCDMVTQGGGWMMIANITSTSAVFDYSLTYTSLVHNTNASSFSILSQITNGRTLLDDSKLSDLDKYINFTQFRIFCTKAWHGRIFHMMSNGNEAGRVFKKYMLREVDGWMPNPNSGGCLSALNPLPDDTSELGLECMMHNNAIQNENAEISRLYGHFMYIKSKSHVVLYYLECDDHRDVVNGFNVNFNYIGSWHFFVR